MNSEESVIARNWDPTPERRPDARQEADFDPYAIGDERRDSDHRELQEALLRHELFSAYPQLRGHDAVIYAAAANIDRIEGTGPAGIRETAKALGARASELLTRAKEDVRREDARARPSRTAGVGGGSRPPGAPATVQRKAPLSLVDAIKRDQRLKGLYR